jgi:hypothetical protein
MSVLKVANKTAEYLDSDDDAFRRKIAEWLIRNRNSQMIRSYVALQQPAKTLFNAINSGRPLKATYKAV